MYIKSGEVTIVNSHFADNAATDFPGDDIWTGPPVIIINSTFSLSTNSISGTLHFTINHILSHGK